MQEEEEEVDDEKEEAQNHTHPLLEPLTCRTQTKTNLIYPSIVKIQIILLGTVHWL